MPDRGLRLRPVREEDLALLEAVAENNAVDDPFNFFGFRPPGQLRRQFAENGLIGEELGKLLVVLGDGTPIGDVSWHPEQYGPPGASHCYNIGISLFVEHRGRGHGGPAQRMLADYLFATTTVHRVEAGTDVENTPERRALEKAGFRLDGVLRGAQWRAGAWHDEAVYSRLRTD